MLEAIWYDKSEPGFVQSLSGFLLRPLGWLYRLVVCVRRCAYNAGVFNSQRLPVKVIVVGNLTVGGTGKTPLVIWLVNFLREQGFTPGVISRGYGGQSREYPYSVTAASDPAQVGDEPVLLAKNCVCPIFIDANRYRAGETLLENNPECDVLICDDGLQHYALERDLEICVIDGSRGHGNGRCLPAGPLREPVDRLDSVDLVVSNTVTINGAATMVIQPVKFLRVDGQTEGKSADGFRNSKVHALAAIGNPERFFQTLRELGLQINPRVFRDHHVFSHEEINPADDLAVIMTEKDAVKCTSIADERHWFLQVRAQLSPEFGEHVLNRLHEAEES